jgi:hypothetical protein
MSERGRLGRVSKSAPNAGGTPALRHGDVANETYFSDHAFRR